MADALSGSQLRELRQKKEIWLRNNPEPWNKATEEEYHARFTRMVDKWLDAGSGSCVLRNPEMAGVVAEALLFFDGERYDMDSFIVMPNHVHVLFRLLGKHKLHNAVKSWKGFTARKINQRLSKKGKFRQEDYWDRMIRNERHFAKCRDYIRTNPLKARLNKGEYIYFTK